MQLYKKKQLHEVFQTSFNQILVDKVVINIFVKHEREIYVATEVRTFSTTTNYLRSSKSETRFA